ncbi:MAG: hypothetical protein Q7S27_01160 [Nanoarchaeota archaeon]|nr:hypothetical protein [Nanoarchaeota archaeon]
MQDIQNNQFLNFDEWIELRKKMFSEYNLGEGRCWEWCIYAYSYLNSIGIHSFYIKEISNRAIIGNGINYHCWLETTNAREKFIADATAGQINSNFPLGFYDFVNNSPNDLRKIYLYEK